MTPARPRFALGVTLAVLAAALTHAGSLGAPFFADDWLFLDQVRARSLFAALASPDPIGNFFRPLGRQLWFWLFASGSGESPVVFHAANLVCWLIAVVLLARLARRVAGPAVGVVAASLFAVHYAADVPVLWASGSQELLAVTLALAALERHAAGRRAWAAVALFLGLLAKEVIVLAPLVAIALDPAAEPWRVRARRAWPLAAAVVAWLALALAAALARGTSGSGMTLTWTGPLAVPLLLVRVAFGLEWETGALPFAHPSLPGAGVLAGLLLAGSAAAGVGRGPRARGAARKAGARRAGPAEPARERAGPEPSPHVLSAALAWALLGALPVSVIAPLWSAYYFLFAIAGVSLALAVALVRARLPRAVVAAVVLAFGLASAEARSLREFATAPGSASAQSHVNRFYLERGMNVIRRCVADLRRQLPRPQPHTTFFFAGLPAFASFQVADGPLVRGVYRDPTLRGFYVSQITRDRLGSGPVSVFFYDPATSSLQDHTRDPGVFTSAALGQLLSGRYEAARATLAAAERNGEDAYGRPYVEGLVSLAQGDTAHAIEVFAVSGRFARGGGEAFERRARAALASGDSVRALEDVRAGLRDDVLHPGLHALAADLMLARPETMREGRLESFAARVLLPERPETWRRWASTLANEMRQADAVAALERYFTLDPGARSRDPSAVQMLELLRRMLPGGDLAQREMRRESER